MRRVAFDYDDVLVDTMGAFIRFHNFMYGTDLVREDFTRFYQCDKLADLSLLEIYIRIGQMYYSPFSEAMVPLPGVEEYLQQLKDQGDELFIVTSRPSLRYKEVTLDQVSHLFPGVFGDVIFPNRGDTEENPKSHVCVDLGISEFYEDNLATMLSCAPVVERCFLVDNPWNQSDSLPGNVRRINDYRRLLL